MKKFPLESVDTELACFYYSTCLPNFEWGNKLYIYLDGTLRAAKPLYSYLRRRDKSFGGHDTITVFNIAGLGEKAYKYGVYKDDSGRWCAGRDWKLFLTPADYDAYCEGHDTLYTPAGIRVTDLVGSYGYKMKDVNTWDKCVMGWCMQNGQPQERPIRIKDVWIDADGPHITFLRKGYWDNDNVKCYLTREECIKDNQPAIIDFDGEVQERETKEYTIPVNLTVRATSPDEAQSKVREICGASLSI